jgi:hypothetical protein
MAPDGSNVFVLQETDGGIIFDQNPDKTKSERSQGWLSGGSGSAVELQYVGNNTYQPLSSSGLLSAK